MDRLGVIPTSSAIALHLLWWLSDKHTNYLPEALPMRTSGLFIGKRPLYLRICPLFSGKCPLLLRICPLFLGKRPLFFGECPLCLLENICCYWENVPCFWENVPYFLENVLCIFWSIGHCARGFLRQSRLCMEGDNNCVISCKLHQSFALSRARVRAYRQEFNDFCCHICHMYILNHYVSVKYFNLYHVLTKKQS